MAASIAFRYTLRREEIYQALKKSGIYHGSGFRVAAENILLFACGAFFVYACVKEFSLFNLAMALISFGFMALVTLVPVFAMNRQAKEQAEKEITALVSPQKVVLEREGEKWEIPLDGSAQYLAEDGYILLITPRRELAVLPVRAFPEGSGQEAKERIFAGARRKK